MFRSVTQTIFGGAIICKNKTNCTTITLHILKYSHHTVRELLHPGRILWQSLYGFNAIIILNRCWCRYRNVVCNSTTNSCVLGACDVLTVVDRCLGCFNSKTYNEELVWKHTVNFYVSRASVLIFEWLNNKWIINKLRLTSRNSPSSTLQLAECLRRKTIVDFTGGRCLLFLDSRITKKKRYL
jgi:hypothetical protein